MRFLIGYRVEELLEYRAKIAPETPVPSRTGDFTQIPPFAGTIMQQERRTINEASENYGRIVLWCSAVIVELTSSAADTCPADDEPKTNLGNYELVYTPRLIENNWAARDTRSPHERFAPSRTRRMKRLGHGIIASGP